jgi:hypothetical protein
LANVAGALPPFELVAPVICSEIRLEVMFQDSTISWARYGLLTPE